MTRSFQIGPLGAMALRVFFGNLRVWIKEDPDRAISELDAAMNSLTLDPLSPRATDIPSYLDEGERDG